MTFLFVGLGGALGAMCRYIFGLLTPKLVFPISILILNLLGSFGLGVFYGVYFDGLATVNYDEPTYLMIAVGFFGALTTFSTFSIEVMSLLQKRLWKQSVYYIALTTIGSILLFLLGFTLFNTTINVI